MDIISRCKNACCFLQSPTMNRLPHWELCHSTPGMLHMYAVQMSCIGRTKNTNQFGILYTQTPFFIMLCTKGTFSIRLFILSDNNFHLHPAVYARNVEMATTFSYYMSALECCIARMHRSLDAPTILNHSDLSQVIRFITLQPMCHMKRTRSIQCNLHNVATGWSFNGELTQSCHL